MPDIVTTYADMLRPIASGRQALTVDSTAGGVSLTVPAKAVFAYCRL